jgi:hypothetical protein
MSALEAVENFKSANNLSARSAQPQDIRQSQWTRPTEEFFKMNWDAALCKTSKNMGVGVVIMG